MKPKLKLSDIRISTAHVYMSPMPNGYSDTLTRLAKWFRPTWCLHVQGWQRKHKCYSEWLPAQDLWRSQCRVSAEPQNPEQQRSQRTTPHRAWLLHTRTIIPEQAERDRDMRHMWSVNEETLTFALALSFVWGTDWNSCLFTLEMSLDKPLCKFTRRTAFNMNVNVREMC